MRGYGWTAFGGLFFGNALVRMAQHPDNGWWLLVALMWACILGYEIEAARRKRRDS